MGETQGGPFPGPQLVCDKPNQGELLGKTGRSLCGSDLGQQLGKEAGPEEKALERSSQTERAGPHQGACGVVVVVVVFVGNNTCLSCEGRKGVEKGGRLKGEVGLVGPGLLDLEGLLGGRGGVGYLLGVWSWVASGFCAWS